MDNSKGIGRIDKDIPSVKRGKNYLFAIAINDYSHFRPLHNAVKDVKDFVDLMVEKYDFEPKYCITLYNKDATYKNIVSKFRNIIQIIKPDDNLIIYYSGHTDFDNTLNEGYWIPVDAMQGEIDDEYLSNSTVIKFLNAINTHHTLLIADAFAANYILNAR